MDFSDSKFFCYLVTHKLVKVKYAQAAKNSSHLPHQVNRGFSLSSTKPKPLEIVEPGGAIYLPYLVLHHTVWSAQKRMSTFLALAA